MRPFTSFDLYAIVNEMVTLKNRPFQKISPIPGGYKLKFRGKDVIIKFPHYLFLSNYSIQAENPDNTALYIRKRLEGKKLISVETLNLDRVVKFDFGEYSLVVELFREGNLILLKEGVIDFVLREGRWRHRELRRGVMYKTPPPPPIPEKLLNDSFIERDMVRSGIPQPYAKEILHRLNIDPKTSTKEVEEEVLKGLKDLLKELQHPEGYVCSNEPFPIRLTHLSCEKKFGTFHEAINLFVPTLFQEEKVEDKRLLYMKQSLNKIDEEIRELETLLNIIYEHWNDFEQLLKTGVTSNPTIKVIKISPLEVEVEITLSQQPHLQ